MRVIDAWAAKAAADPSVISLPAVRVARIARELRGLPEDAARVPHIFGLALPRRLAEAHKSDWGLPDSLPDSDWYLLLPHPDDSDPRAVRRRRAAWLHLQFDKVWDNERPGGPIRQAAEDLWRKLEPIARIEIVEVLVAENRLDPDPDAEEAQREWLATTLEVAAIDPRLAAGWFPQACRYADDIDRVLAMCRPFTLAPELPWPRVADEPPHANVHLDPETLPETTPRPPRPEHRDDLSDMVAGSEEAYERLAGRIARSWGEGVRPEGEWLRLLKGAKVDLKAHDLNKAFRFYYDLQAAADELERVSYANDVVETVLSRNRLKLGRPLELPDDVRVMRRLRSAHKHLEALALPAEIANPWAAALEAATHAAGERVRELIRPRLIEAFAEVGPDARQPRRGGRARQGRRRTHRRRAGQRLPAHVGRARRHRPQRDQVARPLDRLFLPRRRPAPLERHPAAQARRYLSSRRGLFARPPTDDFVILRDVARTLPDALFPVTRNRIFCYFGGRASHGGPSGPVLPLRHGEALDSGPGPARQRRNQFGRRGRSRRRGGGVTAGQGRTRREDRQGQGGVVPHALGDDHRRGDFPGPVAALARVHGGESANSPRSCSGASPRRSSPRNGCAWPGRTRSAGS